MFAIPFMTLANSHINGHIKEPPPPKPLDIFPLCLAVDPQLRVDARSGKHYIAPVLAHKHRTPLRVRIVLNCVQKDLDEYFYRDKVGFVTGRLVGIVKGGRPFYSRPIDSRPSEVIIHGE